MSLAGVALAVIFTLGLVRSSAAQVYLASASVPLPGSQFQGGDGNQVDEGGFIDWQGLQADGRVGHTYDLENPDNVFSGGDKEDQPGGKHGWDITSGSVNAKADILDFYHAIDHVPGGKTFVYLAYTGMDSPGTVYIAFELNQDGRLWDNGISSTPIPCRKTGDLLIAFETHGNTESVVVQRWVTDTPDPTTGCAETGHLVDVTVPADQLQASFNDSDITNYLPSDYPAYDATIPEGHFGVDALAGVILVRAVGDGGLRRSGEDSRGALQGIRGAHDPGVGAGERRQPRRSAAL